MINQCLYGDCRKLLKTLPENSVHCVVTSPPYFGLRAYLPDGHPDQAFELGREGTPEDYVQNLVAVFHEVRRVLRDDGVCWLNLGDSYCGSWGNYKGNNRGEGHQREIINGSKINNRAYTGTENYRPAASRKLDNIKPKDLIMIPARVALALQTDGWWLRSEVVWCKGNALPESVQDRPTTATEKVFLLTKSASYFYDHFAVRETGSNSNRNLRNFWLMNTQSYSGSHFATMPKRLAEIGILAGTSERGCCEKCGNPVKRIVESGMKAHDGATDSAYQVGSSANRLALLRQAARAQGQEYAPQPRTVGWEATCTCQANTAPCVVLDPFFGSGTTGEVAQDLGRNWIGIELNTDYAPLQQSRLRQYGLAV